MICPDVVLPQLSQGYLMDRSKARATEEANSRLERQSRELEAQAKLRHMCERAELDRCRLQMSEFVGPVRTAVLSLPFTLMLVAVLARVVLYPASFCTRAPANLALCRHDIVAPTHEASYERVAGLHDSARIFSRRFQVPRLPDEI